MKTRKKGKGMKKLVCLTAVSALLLMAGCGKQDGAEAGDDGTEGQVTMGRYVETEVPLPEGILEVTNLYRTAGGKLMLTDREGEMFVSEDNGAGWERSDRQWLREKVADGYLMDVKEDSKGIMGIIYAENDGEEPLQSVLLFPDDTAVPVHFSKTGKEETIDRFWISPADRYFVSTMEGTIYEVQKDGSAGVYLTTQGSPQVILFQGDMMVIDGYDFAEPLLYDMEKEAYVEDEVLAAFVKEHYAKRGFNGSSWHNLCLFPGEEGVVYLAGRHGLHRHVIGGAAMEQIVDGRLSHLGSPQYGLAGMVFLETGEFLAVSGQGKMVRFTYDPDKEAVPQEKLKIYSLKEDSDIYSAVSFYQIQNPDVFVEYEVGMEEGGAVTEEDAVKKLNTQIMAGKGPDILMLDGLPSDSYIEKGVLCDLRSLIEEMDGELLGNPIRAWEEENGIYGIPGQIAFPVIMGREGEVSGMNGVFTVADGLKRLREKAPGEDLTGFCSEKAMMKLFATVSSQTWENGGEMDREAVADFLEQMKNIYEAQMDGIGEESLNRLRRTEENYVRYAGEDWFYDLINYGFYMDYVQGYTRAFFGVSQSPRSYAELTSVSKTKGLEDTALRPMEGENGLVFIPQTVLGIVETTQKKELAKDFIRTFLGKENQSSLSGYAVNRAAFAEAFTFGDAEIGERGEYGKIGMVDEDGQEFWFETLVPTAEEIDAVTGWMEKAGTPYVEDTVMETCVLEEGSLYLLGERGLAETLDAVERRLAIYISE